MSPTIRREDYRGSHRYYVEGDDRVNPEQGLSSCSGIASYSNKSSGDGLLYWAVNLYKDSGNRTEFLETRNTAMDIGTQLHAEIEEYIQTQEIPENASDLFGAWYSSVNEKGVAFLAQEMLVYHPYLLYGGTLDAIGDVDGVTTLFDWKTTDEYRIIRDKQGNVERLANGMPKTQRKKFNDNIAYAVQLGGYMSALRAMEGHNIIPQQAYIVYVFKDTKRVHWELVNLDAAERVFASCANLNNNLTSSKKGGLYE